jgi:hypothetical protein
MVSVEKFFMQKCLNVPDDENQDFRDTVDNGGWQVCMYIHEIIHVFECIYMKPYICIFFGENQDFRDAVDDSGWHIHTSWVYLYIHVCTDMDICVSVNTRIYMCIYAYIEI